MDQSGVACHEIKGLSVLITGASGGIGRRLTERYQEAGAQVTGMCSSDCDLSVWEETAAFFGRCTNIFDLAIHTAGVNIPGFFYKIMPEDFRRVIEVNVLGTFHLLKSVIPKLTTWGSVMLFGSMAASAPSLGQAAYACSKSALMGLVKVLAGELAAENKSVFLLAPGLVDAGMALRMMGETALARACHEIPTKRFCSVDEIFRTIEYLRCMPYLTGQSIHLTGGRYIP